MASSPQTMAPPRTRMTAGRWLHKNLFSTWYNSLLTVIIVALLASVLYRLGLWIFTAAEWEVVLVNLRLFMVGPYPADQLWRLWLCVALATTLLGLSWGIWPQVTHRIAPAYGAGLLVLGALVYGVNLAFATDERQLFSIQAMLLPVICGGLVFGGRLAGRRLPTRYHRYVTVAWIAFLPGSIYLMHGLGVFLPVVPTSQWGGLQLTMVLAVVSILLSFPLGVLLAIGRRSSLPAINLFCTLFIELIRGVPLITVLFMFQIMLPLFIPGGESIDRVARAIVAFTIFTAAYIAENVRGGLQAIPRGQFEASRALGLNPFLTMGLVILPQALRTVIPANVGQFISLFKDTSLVLIASQLDLLGVARNAAAQPAFLGRFTEIMLFVALVYWVFAFSMTHISKRLEEVLGVGKR